MMFSKREYDTMKKTILITGSTDGIGLETAKRLLAQGHHVLLHGRNPSKLADIEKTLSKSETKTGSVESFVADFSRIPEVETLAKSVMEKHATLDVLINNAGVFHTPKPITEAGLDTRFVVNTLAPYLLTKRLIPLLKAGRVINLSSAAQAPVNLEALKGQVTSSDDFNVYAQSKLAITMWSQHMALALKRVGENEGESPAIIAVNPGSMLGSKMVKEGFGVDGGDIGIGAEILRKVALDDEFADASGKYFDNDIRQFTSPHPDVFDSEKSEKLIQAIEMILSK